MLLISRHAIADLRGRAPAVTRGLRCLIRTAVLLLAIASCRDSRHEGGVATHDPNIRAFSTSDPAMQAAMARARGSVGELVRRLDHPPRSQTFISAKVRVVDGAEIEHIWLDSLRYDGHQLFGRLNDDPVVVRNARRGDAVRVAPSDITDWMAVDGGRLCGGYTLRVQRRRLSVAERAALDSDLNLVRVPDDTTICAPAR